MNRLAPARRWVASAVRRSGEGVSRFPVAVLAILAFAAVSHLAVAGRVADSDLLLRLLAALPGAGASAVAVALFLEARGVSAPIRAAASALVAGAMGSAIGWSEPFPIYAPALLAASVAAVPLAPFAGRSSPAEFWSFAFWSAVGLVLSFVTVLLFCVGVQAILEMVRFLFRTPFLESLDRHLYTLGTTLIGPLFALGRIPVIDAPQTVRPEDDRLLRAVRPLAEWVLAPLVLVTALVLHIYAGRIVLTGELPANEIGWIVLTFTMLLLAQRLALEPFARTAALPARMLERFWWAMCLVPLALLGVALAARIGSQGVTAERYYLALWWLSLALSVLLQVPARTRSDIRLLLAVPVVLLAASTFGPWGVADTVGRNQVARIAAESPQLLAASRLQPAILSPVDLQRLRTRLHALSDVRELGRLRGELAAGAADDPIWSATVSVASVEDLLARPAPVQAIRTERRQALRGSPLPLELDGYSQALVVSALDGLNPSGTVGLDGRGLGIRFGGRVDRLDLAAALERDLPEGSDAVPDLDLLTDGGRAIRVRILELAWGMAAAGEAPPIASLSAVLLLRAAEWK